MVLVCLEVRGSRLSGWTQRACAAAAGRRHLAATPARPEWTDFASRTAELAVLLAG